MTIAPPRFHELPNGERLAYRLREGASPTIVFLSGFRSDMEGAKAVAMDALAENHGWSFLRFDYLGHGSSSGEFTDYCLTDWIDNALTLIDNYTSGELLLIGSSMGGAIMLHVALRRAERVKGLVGIAAAPDFTERLMFARMNEVHRQTLIEEGKLMCPSEYGEPYAITRKLIEDGRNHLLLDAASIPIHCPVHLLHGMADADVPWEFAPLLASKLATNDVQITLIKDAGHRLSRESDLAELAVIVKRSISLIR